jgi:hypothetical protein
MDAHHYSYPTVIPVKDPGAARGTAAAAPQPSGRLAPAPATASAPVARAA